MSRLIDTILDGVGEIVFRRNDVTIATVDASGNITTTGSVNGNYRYVPASGDTTGVTDAVAIQAAHTAFGANGGTILLGGGPYYLAAGTVNFTNPIHLIGSGPNGPNVGGTSDGSASYQTTGSVINCASATGVAITVNADGCSFEKLSLFNTAGSTPTAGAGLQIASLGRSNRIVDCSFTGFWIDVDVISGYEWYMSRCHFYNPVKYGLQVSDVPVPDGGDGIVSDSFFISGPTNLTPTAGIQWNTGGGLKVLGSKFNCRGTSKFTVGVNFAISDNLSTLDAQVVGCSLENMFYGILVGLAAGNTGQFRNVVITSNELNCSTNCIAVLPAVAGKIKDVVIAGNLGAASGGFISLGNVDGVTLAGNHALVGTTPLVVGTGVTNLFFDDYSFTTAARPAATKMRSGARYYDTTLSKPAWSDGTAWRDAAGTAV